jgi:predicted PolB exonuclease-like 3'-5' exonuclease
MNVFFDIETIPTQRPGALEEFCAAVKPPAQYSKPESIEKWLHENRAAEGEAAWLKTSFDGGEGQIVCIGWAVDGGDPDSFTAVDTSLIEEAQIILSWFNELTKAHSGRSGTRPVLIGHNHVSFDIPFIWKRCMIHGIKPPHWFPRNPKPWADSVIDTMTLWDANQKAGGSMDRLCRLLGIPGKGDFGGADVWPAVKAGEFAKVADYCRDDVRRTRAMYERMTFSDAGRDVAGCRITQGQRLEVKA